jgi:hypothetical protein
MRGKEGELGDWIVICCHGHRQTTARAVMRRIACCAWLFAAIATVAAAPAVASQRFALLIGNLDYKPEVGALHNPKRDIDLIASALKQIGFAGENIVKEVDVTGDQLRELLERHVKAVKAAGDGAISFFYYSGHGAAAPKNFTGEGRNFLIPVDIESTRQANFWQRAVALETIGKMLEEAPLARHIIIFDACRNELQLPERAARKGFEAVVFSEYVQTFYAFATAFDRPAYDVFKESDNSPFAKALATELVKPGLDHLHLFSNVRLSVMDGTKGYQIPWWHDGLLQALHLGPSLASEPDPHKRCEILSSQATPRQSPAIEWTEVADKQWIKFTSDTYTYADARITARQVDEVAKGEAHEAAPGTKIYLGKVRGEPAWYRYNRAFGTKASRYVIAAEAELR